ncbi:hypothetical protein Tco_1026657 [Tanacetum coccineum]
MHTIHDAEEPVPMPHDSPLPGGHTLGSAKGRLQLNELMDLVTKLTDRVGVLEHDLQRTKQVYSSAFTKLILRVKKLEKKGSKISDIDKDPTIYLVQGEGTTCFRMMQRFMRRLVVILRFFLIKKSLLSLWKILVVEKRVKKRLVLLMFQGSTASAIPEVSTAGRQVYIRRSAKKRKDKGKAVMQESDPSKKIKKRVQVQMSVDEELAQKLHEEEKARFNVEQEAKALAEQ